MWRIAPVPAEYIKNENPRTPQFYLLSKIHKGTVPPAGHLIISANDSPSERISQVVDYFLEDMLSYIKSYLKDTTGTIVKLKALSLVNGELWGNQGHSSLLGEISTSGKTPL